METTKDPVQEERDESPNRVLRGGSWNRNAGRLAASYRNIYAPEYRYNSIGFRLARNTKEKR
jgi:formylglycine-generating enzyme required for sulfatase activity